MKKSKFYYSTKFSSDVIKKAHDQFLTKIQIDITTYMKLSIKYKGETWGLDSLDEFFAEYPKSDDYTFHHMLDNCNFYIDGSEKCAYVSITLSLIHI